MYSIFLERVNGEGYWLHFVRRVDMEGMFPKAAEARLHKAFLTKAAAARLRSHGVGKTATLYEMDEPAIRVLNEGGHGKLAAEAHRQLGKYQDA